jgi:nucleotide-binding universal stress UspA family protein
LERCALPPFAWNGDPIPTAGVDPGQYPVQQTAPSGSQTRQSSVGDNNIAEWPARRRTRRLGVAEPQHYLGLDLHSEGLGDPGSQAGTGGWTKATLPHMTWQLRTAPIFRRRRMATATPSKIMLATDLTPAGDRAFDRAVQLAQQWNAELIVCHVIESSAMRPWGAERRAHNATTELERLVRASPLTGKLRRHIIIGDPAELVLRHARDIGCDLIVTGPAHGRVLGEKLLGSTAARIVRWATQPVLSVRRRPEGAYRNVVAAVDFSEASLAAVRRSREMFPECNLTAVHAYGVSPDWGGANAEKSIDVIESEERERVSASAKREMADLLAALGDASASVDTELMEGPPDAVLADFVEKQWPDLVVTGTYGRAGPQEGSIGSVAERLLTTLKCDVLVVPARG